MAKKNSYIVAIDAGGTMTDAVVIDQDGNFEIGKFRTFRADESESYMGAVAAVSEKMGISTSEIHKNCSVSIYAGTAMTNTVLTMDGDKVGLIITRGMEHMGIIENGLTSIGQSQREILHQQLRRHTVPFVKQDLVRGVSERVTGGSYFGDAHLPTGHVFIPLNKQEVEEAAIHLIRNDVDSIGIMFLNSHVFPDHEEQAAEIVRKVIAREGKGKDIKVVLSKDIAPVGKDNFRLKSLLVQCFAAEKARRQLGFVEEAARKDGYQKELLTLLSFGGAVSIKYPRLYESLISGPIGGLTTAKEFAKLYDLDKVAMGDVGGTSYDVGLILDKRIELRPDSDFAKHRMALPMIAIDSAALGMGTEVKVNDYGNIEVGPESAGYRVGVCLDYDKLTITDLQVVLGYIAPNSFLGGKLTLNREAALSEVEKAASKLGIGNIYEAAEGLLGIFFTNLREFTKTCIESKGYNTKDFVLLLGGGGGLVNMHGIAHGGIFKDVVTTPFGSTLSAFGVGCADLVHRYNQGVVHSIRASASKEEKAAVLEMFKKGWEELKYKAVEEFKLEGVSESEIKFVKGVFMRYTGQLESFETKLDFDLEELDSADTVDKIIVAFEKHYESMFPAAAKFTEAGFTATNIFLEAVGPKIMPKIQEYEVSRDQPVVSETRKVYHRGRWIDFSTYRLEALKAGQVINGPAIVYDDISTIVVAEGDKLTLDKHRFMHYKA